MQGFAVIFALWRALCMHPCSCAISCAHDQVHVLREEHEVSDEHVKEALAGKEELATQLSKVMKVMCVESARETQT